MAEDEATETPQGLQTLLLLAPTLSDEELQEFDRVRKWMNKWKVKKLSVERFSSGFEVPEKSLR